MSEQRTLLALQLWNEGRVVVEVADEPEERRCRAQLHDVAAILSTEAAILVRDPKVVRRTKYRDGERPFPARLVLKLTGAWA